MIPSLAIGPLNTAGQAYQWSEAVARELGISSWSFSGSRRSMRRIDGPVHHRIPHHRLRPSSIRKLWVQSLIRSRTHLLVESMASLLGDPLQNMLHDELGFMQDRGLAVGVVCHGSDIRSPARHMARLGQSYFQLWEESARTSLEEKASRTRAAIEMLGIPAFVSTPDLILDLPSAVWLPLVIDTRSWTNDMVALKRRRPVVLHAPSRRKPPIKGTDIVEPVLLDLDRRGMIDYRAPTGMVPHISMPGLIKEADVVVEQILTGSYGVSAVEGMASGRLVIGYVGDKVRATMPEDPPILDTTPEGFLSTMMHVIDKPADFADLAASGPSYVDRIHSGRMSAQVLASFLGM